MGMKDERKGLEAAPDGMGEDQNSQIIELLKRDGLPVKEAAPVSEPSPVSTPAPENKEPKPEDKKKEDEVDPNNPMAGMSPDEQMTYMEELAKKEPPIEDKPPEPEPEKKEVPEPKKEDSEKTDLEKRFEALEAQNRALLEQLNKVSSVPVPEPKKEEKKEDLLPLSGTLTEDEFRDMFTSQDKMKEGLRKLGLGQFASPHINPGEVLSLVESKRQKDAFFSENKDLAAIQGYVEAVGAEIANDPKNINLSMKEVLEQAEKRVRDTLHIPKTEAKPEVESKPVEKDPAFAPAPKGGSPKPKQDKAPLSGDQREINELLQFAERR